MEEPLSDIILRSNLHTKLPQWQPHGHHQIKCLTAIQDKVALLWMGA